MTRSLPQSAIVAKSASVASTAMLGVPYRPLQTGALYEFGPAVIENDVFVGHYVIIGTGTRVGSRSIIDDHVKIECGVSIGERALLQYRAYISNETRLGSDCVVGGFITEHVTIGNRCRIFGSIVHRHPDPAVEWDADSSQEESAMLDDNVFVGFGAVIIGGVRICAGAYIAANAVVSKNVPELTRVTGINQHQRLK